MKIINRIKLQRKKIGMEKSAFDSIIQEIAILKKLDHPNIVQLYEVIDDPSCHKLYIVMDFIRNGSILKMLDEGPINEILARRFFRDLISGLYYCKKNVLSKVMSMQESFTETSSQKTFL
jgi:[calcium/calmodulin-dependent protein kinase] kinase